MNEYAGCVNSFEQLLFQNKRLVELIGDCPNIERHVASEPLFWETIAEKKGYKCQENILSGRCRIVSSKNTRVANGSKKVMLEKMDRLTSEDFFRPGDVIGVLRAGMYEHYGIYLGKNQVIHYCGEGNDFAGNVTIHEAPFSEFIKNSKYCFVIWFDEGRPVKIQERATFLGADCSACYEYDFRKCKREIYSAEETIRRAKQRLGERKYNLISNNCEHFAMWCKTGVSESSQVKQMVRFAIGGGIVGYDLLTSEPERI